MLVDQWFGAVPAAVVCWTLIVVGLVAALLRGSAARLGERQLALLAGLWLTLPTGLLILESVLVEPTYNMRYLTLSTPAAAMLIALGMMAAARWCSAAARRLRLSERVAAAVPGATAVALLALVVAASAPVYVEERGPFAKDEGSDWRQVSAYVGAHAGRGDAVVFDESTRPSEDPRLALRLYPSGFAGLQDVELRRRYDERPWLWDDVTLVQATFARLTPTVWAVELPRGRALPADIAALTADGYRVTSAHLVHRDVVYRLQKSSAGPPSSPDPDGV
ncbi:hypothetical protein [Naasia aerilata]|uniref:Transmembrane protein n=1 Tax=Naasia aerilata TaxID=1162966 RepID=A0ABM8GC35_9MICO|nr:hypothetical protein [Naasia aerilata]BDZ45802.1 hypothetical protein GCM10025866_17110 [Naasia aerilata]